MGDTSKIIYLHANIAIILSICITEFINEINLIIITHKLLKKPVVGVT